MAGCSSSGSPKLATTQLALATSAASVNLNASVTLTATLSGGSKPIGTITFYDGTTALQPVAITAGQTSATYTTSTLAAGAHSLTASYSGDPSDATSTSSPVAVSVYVPTTVTVAAPAYADINTSVTLTATVATNPNTYDPTGTVTFFSGTTSLGAAPVATAGGAQQATLTLSTLPLGTDAITASYAPSGYFLASTSPVADVDIFKGQIPTSSTLAVSPGATIASGTLTTLTATLAPGTTASASPTGSFTFYDGSVVIGTAAISNDVATLATKQFNVGANSLTAVYSGDPLYATSTSAAETLTMSAYTGATYTNPLNVTAPSGKVYSCPDPAIIKSQSGGSDTWYVYCTGDVLNSVDNKNHLISIYSSTDLVNWTYVRDALSALPAWAGAGQQLATPAIKLINGVYTLYYWANAAAAPYGPEIGVATASSPAGPFTDTGTPVIAQQLACGGGCNRTVYAPEIVADPTNNDALYIVYGGVYAGISIRPLSANGQSSNAADEINIGVDNYYQDPYIWYHDGYFYEFLTAGSPYGGPYASDNVHVGRSKSILGPYDDAEGNDLNAYSTPATQYAPGGDPVLVMNGNDIVGAGSNSIFTDESGQDYILYSGISKKQPYLPNYGGYNARQLMMDALDWSNGWPRARNGFGPSDSTQPQPVPAAQPGAANGYVTPTYVQDYPGTELAAYSDDFNETTLNTSQWTFLHAPATYTMTGTAYSVAYAPDESVYLPTMEALPILSEPAPTGNYLVEIKVSSTSSPTAFYTTNQQCGMFIYNADEDYLRLDEFPDFDTRQIEYLNQYGPGILGSGTSLYDYAFAPVGTPNFYGNTWLRIAHRVGVNGNPDTYTVYSSTDGITYLTGPTWTKSYISPKIGIFAGNTAGYTATFDYIHVYDLLP
jgi:arabinan endo-1,5-alpha-L-arabinosidase